jgi:hypothetical protein
MAAELPLIFPQKVVWRVARLVPASATTALENDFLMGMIRTISQAVFQLSRLPLRSLAFGCALASGVFPDEFATALRLLQTGHLTAFSAFCSILTMCHARWIVLIAAYQTWRKTSVLETWGEKTVPCLGLEHRGSFPYIVAVKMP